MTNWVEIFRAGRHTSSSGVAKTYSAADVAAIARAYDPSHYEAPIVVGHPKDNAPAYGWVEKLKAEGGRLFASFKQVNEGFREAVRSGAFKTRSVSLFPNLDGRGLSLRHVGFLGAAPPAVKGMEAVAQFHDGEFETFEFQQPNNGGDNVDVQELTKTLDERFKSFSETVKGWLPGKPQATGDSDVKAQVEAAVTARTADLGKQLQEFGEQVKGLQGDLKEARESAEAGQRISVAEGVSSFREKMRGEGRWVPAFDALGVYEFMQALAAGGDEIEFSQGEGDDKTTVKQTPLEFFQGFIRGLPKIVEFKEVTPRDKQKGSNVVQFNAPGTGQQVENLDLAERAEAIAADKKLEYGEALKLARREQRSASA